MKISREFKVGGLIVISILLMYWGVNFLKGNDIFQEKRYYYAVYENIEGLTVNKPVNINGLKVGQITNIYFHPDLSGRLVVVFDISSEYPIPSNTVAKIHSIGFLGERAIALSLGNSFDMIRPGDTLYSGVESNLTDAVSQQIAPIKEKTEKLLGSLENVIDLLTGFLNKKTQQDFVATVVNLRETFENLEKASESLNHMISANEDSISKFIGNLTSLSQVLAANGDNLNNIMTNFSNISDTIAQANISETIIKLNDVMTRTDSIMGKINNGEGTIGMLINDPELYNNLADATSSLDRLLLDIKYNPNKYLQFSVFSSKTRLSEQEIEELEELRKQQETQSKQDSINKLDKK